jgi:hypothetical protein
MRREFRNVVLSTQDMAPDTEFFPFFISGILGAKAGWNVIILAAFRCSDFTGITFAFLRRFRELAWIGLEWTNSSRLSTVGGRWQLRKAALENQVMVSDTWFFPLASLEESFLEYISL